MKSPRPASTASSGESTPAKACEAEPSASAEPIRKLRRSICIASIAIELVEPYRQARERSELAPDELADVVHVEAQRAQLARAFRIALLARALFYRGRGIVCEPLPRLFDPAGHPGLVFGNVASEVQALVQSLERGDLRCDVTAAATRGGEG